MNRRSLMLSGLAVAAGTGLVACTGDPTTPGTPPGDQTTAVLPDHIPYTGVTADGEPTTDGVMAMFSTFPSDRATYGAEVASGVEPITVLSQTDGAAPPILNENPFWQELNRRLGTPLNFNMVPLADLAAKQAVAVAGGDSPDLMQVKGRKSIPQLGSMLEANFADLTDELSGDRIAQYPGLAAIAPKAWETVVFNGRIRGIPQPSGVIGDILFVRSDLVAERGLSTDFADQEEFVEFCRTVSDPARRRWALNSITTLVPFLYECLGAPVSWTRQDDGSFVNVVETDQARAALDFAARLWKEDVVHPDAFTGSGALTEWFANGTTVMNRGGFRFADIVQNANAEANPELRAGLVVPFSFDGTTPTKHLTNGTAGFTVVAKGATERIQQILSVANWLAPPFGTEESVFRSYGVEGEQFDFVDGEPVVRADAAAQLRLPLNYTFRPPQVLYSPGRPESAQEQYDYQVATIPTGQYDPTEVLTSETDERHGANLARSLDDVRDGVIQGRSTLEDWDSAVAQWRTDGGDVIRQEYVTSWEAAQDVG